MRRPMIVTLLAGLLVMTTLLTGCSGTNATSQTPEDVHAQWIAALQSNNRSALLNLAAEQDFKTSFVDDSVRRMQDYIANGYETGYVTGGAFQGVDVLELTDIGQGKTGWSRWRFADLSICYATTLTPTETGWRVLDWGQRSNCGTT